MEVEDYHTYFVGRNGVCVHNAGCGSSFKKLNEKTFMKDNHMSSKEFHQYKADLIKDSGINKNLYGKNPDIWVYKDTFQIAFKSTVSNGPKDLFITNIFETFYKIRW